jgi:HlyD family secretion protein
MLGSRIINPRRRLYASLVGPLLLVLASCGNKPSGAQTVTVGQQRFEGTVSASGLVTPAVQSKLNFRASGVFTAYKVKVGDHVDANQDLATIDAPDLDLAIANAKYDVANASSGLRTAQAKLTAIQNGAKQGSVQQATGNLAKAQAHLQATTDGGRAEDVATKAAALDAAQAKLDLMTRGPRPEAVAQAQAQLDSAKAKQQALKDGPPAEQVAIWRSQIEQAKNSLLAAQLSRDATCGFGKGGACDAGQAQVNSAQNGVDIANQQLALGIAPPRPAQLAQAQADVDAAQHGLELAQKPYMAEDIRQQQDLVTQAQQALALAKQPSDSHDVAQAQADVQAAQGALTLARSPYEGPDVDQAQAAVDQAQAQLDVAQARLSNATLNAGYRTLKAPYAGTILAETAKPGEQVGSDGVSTTQVVTSRGDAVAVGGNAAVVIGSDEGLTVNADVDVNDIVHVSVGEPVSLTFDGLPGVSYKGTVAMIPPQEQSVQNIQQYIVQVALDIPAGAPQPRAGMTANCTFTYSKDNVLVVPTSAIQNENGRSVATVQNGDGSTQTVPVQTGATNSDQTEIVGGLKAGQQLLLRSVPPPAK